MAYIYISVLLSAAVATAIGASVTAEQSSYMMRRDAPRTVELGSDGDVQLASLQQKMDEQPGSAQQKLAVELGSDGEMQPASLQQKMDEQPHSGVATRPDKWWCVVNIGSGSGGSVQGPYYKVNQARSVLNASPGSATNLQMICEMNAAGFVTGAGETDPPQMVGGKNQGAGAEGGFLKFWRGPEDITTMNQKCLDDSACAGGLLMFGAHEASLLKKKTEQPHTEELKRRVRRRFGP